jgi:dienelactone hydrolase
MSFRWVHYRLLMGSLWFLACSLHLRAGESVVIESPADLWQGYDPTELPLDVESLQRWEEQGCAFEKLRFTAEEVDGGKVRVFAIAGTALSGPAQPGILHIHGGGQTASLEWVRFWTKRGYACVTYDFCGPWSQRTDVTDWGPLKQGNMAFAEGGHQVTPTPRASSWYHWTLVARRSLTLLTMQPRVDPERLGIFGISVGGTLCWSVAGSDPRVKTAVPIYGCGYIEDGRRARWGFAKLTPELALFQRVVSPEAHAPYITCPLLHLNSTNDFHGWMDSAYDILSATDGPRWQAFTPRQNHHIAPAQGSDLPAWMDYQLKGGPPFPALPTVAVRLNPSGIPQANVATGEESIDHVDVYYSLTDKPPPNRFWRRVRASIDGANWNADLPVIDPWDSMFTFANVYYVSGICLTTNLEHRVPGALGKARATLRRGNPLAPRVIAESWFYARAYTDPQLEKTFIEIEDTPERPAVVSLNEEVFGDLITVDISSHFIGDPQLAGPDGAALAFDCTGDFGTEGLRVSVTQNDWTPLAQTYVATVAGTELDVGWTTIVLPVGRLTIKDTEKSPIRWQELDKINIQGTTPRSNPFRIANLRWLSKPSEE